MSEIDGITELAAMLQGNKPQPTPSITTGVVVSPPPNAKIRFNEVIVLDNSHLIFSAAMLGGYKRQFKFSDKDCGTTNSVNDGGQGASSHSHKITTLNVDTEVTFTNTVEVGDEVILMPVNDGQQFYVLDKAVRF